MIPDLLHSKMDDFEILDRVLAGETGLYEIIIRRYNPLLYKIARSYSLQHEDAEDMMQDTFITAYEKLAQFRKESQLGTWLARILINKCIYKMKKDKKNTSLSATGDDGYLQEYLADDLKENFPLQAELKKILEISIEKLPEPYRLVFLLRETENFSVARTAEILGISEINVKVRLNRAKAMMRGHIEKWYSKTEIYEFHLKYCNSVVEKVFQKISLPL